MSQTVKLPEEGIQHIQVADLTPYARNARKHPEAQIDQIAASIREFGFLSPILVSSDLTIIAGHGRLLAAQKLGMDLVPCVVADHLTEAQRRAYVLIDNRLTDTSEWDKDLLQIELGDLALSGIDIALMGFSPAEIDDFAFKLDDPDNGDDDDLFGNAEADTCPYQTCTFMFDSQDKLDLVNAFFDRYDTQLEKGEALHAMCQNV